MAQVRVSRHKAENSLLPPVCVCCGAPATQFPQVTLAMTAGSSFDSCLTALPEFLQRFILETISPIVALVIPLRSGEMTRCTLRPPVCRRHVHHWCWHRLILLTVGALALSLLVGAFICFLDDENCTFLFLGSAGALALWLLVLAWQRRSMVHAVDGTRSTVVLAAVCPVFVEAVLGESGQQGQAVKESP